MKNAKRLFSLLLCLALLLSLAVPALAQETYTVDSTVYSAVVRFEEGADADTLCDALEKLPGISVRWRYGALFSGAAVEGNRAALALALAQTGVASLSLSRTWTQADTVTEPLDPSNSLSVMRAEDVGYEGDGMVVAVLDSGLKLSHEAFADYGIMDAPALGREDVESFIAAGGTEGRYVSEKIPYVYDYCGKDRSVHTNDHHGTHVSALAAGYAEYQDGSVKFRGAAPAAQLLGMKVFPDDASKGADDADILKAMEDAYLLGADVINLSLGTTDPFMDDGTIGSVYSEVIAALEQAGVVVCCAVGNSGTSLTGMAGDAALPGCEYTDYASVCAPAVFRGAAAIAAVSGAYYEAGGGIVAGERTIVYTETISETGNEFLPSIRTLTGRELEYVVIGGLGTAEDFAGLDLTGCAAVVQRGEIYFSEKTRNAAAAGAELCIIYNNEPGTILPAASDISIPCVLITQEDGEYLIEQAQGGRGTITVIPDRVRVGSENGVTMLDFSSWGATPDLRLAPTLSAPGGTILSAGISADHAYEYLSGTSMAAPNAAGVYALLMQALRERGVEDRAQRLRLASMLLESTAQIVTDGDGVPLSPRRQGAGVIDLAAALSAGAVLTEPMLELGESGTGVCTISFTVRNLTGEEKVFAIDTRVLTDAFTEVGGVFRSTLSPLEITGQVRLMGMNRVRVAPMGEQTVTLTLTVPPQVQEELGEVYRNGFYTEGYVFLTDERGETIHATFLGYCGDWEAAPILESVDFRAVMDAYYEQEMGVEGAVEALGVNMGINYVLLCSADMETYGALLPGENPWLVTRSNDARIAMSTVQSDAILYTGDRFVIDLFTLRNAEHVIMVVSDQRTGEIYCADDRAWLTHSAVSESVGQAASAARFIWNGTDLAGQTLPGGTAVTVAFYAWLESETHISDAYTAHAEDGNYEWLLSGDWEAYREWAFPLVLDATAPKVSCTVDPEEQIAKITVTDSHFVAYISVQDEEGTVLASDAYAGERAGERYELTVSLEECAGQMLYVTAADYAGNRIGYEIDLSQLTHGIAARCERCAVAMLTDVDKNAWYHEAVDFVMEQGLMDAGDDLAFSPHTGALRVHVLELLYELAGRPLLPQGTVVLPFADVPTGSGYRAALEWAYSNGIVTGYDETLFGAYAPVQRSQLAAMLYRAAQMSGNAYELDEDTMSDYADGDTVPEWAAQALGWAVEMGYLRADEQGNLNPASYVTRAEFAHILMLIYEN